MYFPDLFVFWENVMVLINIYAIFINQYFPHWKKYIYFLRFSYYFLIMAVFHVKKETMPLKSNVWISQISAIWSE